MVTVINYQTQKNTNDEVFYSLIIQGGIEMVKSKKTGQYYATTRRATIPTTFDEDTCLAMVGEKFEGQVAKVQCEEYDYTNPETGEVVQMNHRWEYLPEEPTPNPVFAFSSKATGELAKVVH